MGKKKKGDGAAKTAAKTAKAELKALKKETGEDDIDQLLADLRVKDAQQTAITITACDMPTPRSSATWLPHPTKPEMILFGGEFYDGRITSVYNDLFIYNIPKKEWRKVTSANCPPPRSAHQAVIVDKQDAPEMWLFGGEFTSPSGNQFYHFRDLWVLDLNTYKWELKAGEESKGGGGGKASKKSAAAAASGSAAGPSPRSGHRMAVYKHKLLIFGGFYAAGQETKYFSDLHAWDLGEMQWLPELKGTSALSPSARSGFGFFVNEATDSAYVFAGFSEESKKKEEPKKGAAGAPVKKKSAAPSQAPQVPVTHSDLWQLNLLTMAWTNLKRRGYYPAAGRFAMAATTQREKQRAFVFGGVKDVTTQESGSGAKGKRRGGDSDDDSDEDDEDALAVNFNDLYCFDLRREQLRFFFVDYKGVPQAKSHAFEVSVKVKEKDKDKKKDKDDAAAGKDEEDEAAGGDSVFDFNPVVESAVASAAAASSPAAASSSASAAAASSSSAAPVPAPRRSSMLCVKNGVLYLYGGVQEASRNDGERTFGDLWALDTSKASQSWTLLQAPKEEAHWAGSDAEEEGEGEEEKDEASDASDDDEEEEKESDAKRKKDKKAKKEKKSKKEKEKKKKKKAADSSDEEDDEDDSDGSSDEEDDDDDSGSALAAKSASSCDPLAPQAGESLTVYFARTKAHWMAEAPKAIEADRAAEEAAEAARKKEEQAQRDEEEQQRQKQEEELATANDDSAADAAAAPESDAAAAADDSALSASEAAQAAGSSLSLSAEEDAAALAKEAKKAAKAEKKAAKAEKAEKKEKKSSKSASSSASASAAAASAPAEKELRTKAFELASARFQAKQ